MFGAAVATSTMTPNVWAQSKSQGFVSEQADPSVTLTSPNFLRGAAQLQLHVQATGGNLQLRGILIDHSVPQHSADEVVTAIKLKLDFCIPFTADQSPFEDSANGEGHRLCPRPRSKPGELVREISIDPRLVSDFNRLSLRSSAPHSIAKIRSIPAFG